MDPVESALSALDGIPYLSACGEPFAGSWAEAIPGDWQGAFLARALDPDWAMRRLNASEAMRLWAGEMEPEFLDEYRGVVKERLSGPIQDLVRDRIWGRLPSKIRRADASLRFQVRSLFTFDLTNIALNGLLRQRWMSPGLYGMVSDAYRAGRFPCGYKGEYPGGRILIY